MNSGQSALSSAWLAARSLLWTILVPGVVAGYVPGDSSGSATYV
jgi:hypothetical protein